MKYSSILLSAAAGLMCMMTTSCADDLDIAPDGSLSMDEVIQDPVKVSGLLASCYSNIPQKGYTYLDWESLFVALSDDAWSSADGTGGLPVNSIYGDRHSSGSHPIRDNCNMTSYFDAKNGQPWTRYWQQIFRCNQFLDVIDKAAVNSEAERSRFKAEARLLRAFFYSELIHYFGKLPILDHLTSFEEDFSAYTRRPVKEVVDFMFQDLDYALACPELPWRITTEAEAMRVTKALAWAIKSRMSMFAASPLFCEGQNYWEWAYQTNLAAVKALEENGYELFTNCTDTNVFGTSDKNPENAYRQLVVANHLYSASPDDRETIWQHATGDANHYQWHIAYIGCGEANTAFTGACPTQELVDAFDTTDGKPVLDPSNPYKDKDHLEPNYVSGTIYDPAKPYSNRDPRMMAVVMYHNRAYRWDGKNQKMNMLFEQDVTGAFVAVNKTKNHCPSLNTTDRTRSRTGYYNCKFLAPNVDGTVNQFYSYNKTGKSKWKFYRMAEIYLNLAECALEAGHEGDAVKYASKTRARVGMPDLPADGNLRERIRNERRVELCYEENRYFDLRRWSNPEDASLLQKYTTVLTGMRAVKVGNKVEYRRYRISPNPRGGAAPRDLLLPLSNAEASRMESVTGESWQNPQW